MAACLLLLMPLALGFAERPAAAASCFAASPSSFLLVGTRQYARGQHARKIPCAELQRTARRFWPDSLLPTAPLRPCT
jgi:hypothetical protein